MHYYSLRCDLCSIKFIDLLSVVKEYSKKYAYCHEGGQDNPHTHFYIEMETTSQHFRKRLRALGLSGNGSYSLKKLDEQYPMEYLAYLSKEKDYNFDLLPTDVVQRALDYNLKVAMEIAEKKKKKRKIVDLLEDYLIENKFNVDSPNMEKECVRLIIFYHQEKSMLIRKGSVIAYTHTILAKLSHQYKERLIQSIYQDL